MTSGKPLAYPDDAKFAQSHEWVRIADGLAVIGISDYAQDSLGDVVFVELPAVGAAFDKGESFGVVESVKAASDLYAPVSGTVQAVNEKLTESPETINQDAFGEGWILKLAPSNPAEVDQLMSAATYKAKIESGELH